MSTNKTYERRCVVVDPVIADQITDQQLFEFYTAFQRRIILNRQTDGRLIMWSADDQAQERLRTLTPLLKGAQEQVLAIDKQRAIQENLFKEIHKVPT